MDTTKPIHLIIDTSILRASPYIKVKNTNH